MDPKIEEISKDFLSGAIELLSELINKNIEIAGFSINEMPISDAEGYFTDDILVIPIKLEGDIDITNLFLLSQSFASYLSSSMMGEEPVETATLDDTSKANVADAFGQLAVVISMFLSMNVNANIQSRLEDMQIGVKPDSFAAGEDSVLVASLNLAIDGFSEKMEYMMPASMIAVFEKASSAGEQEEQEQKQDIPVETPVIDITSHIEEMPEEEPEIEQESVLQDTPEPARTAAFESLEQPSGIQQPSTNIDLLMDIPLEVTVELGRTKMLVKDVLEIAEGSIIELNKLAGEPVDFYVNGKLVSKGEVVVIDENFGIRITEIVSPAERITSLNSQ